MFEDMVRAYTRTRSETLWTVFDHTGVPVAIRGRPDELTCPMFSTEGAAEEWLMGMQLEQHVASKPLRGQLLVDFLDLMRRGGFTSIGLDPPKVKNAPFAAAPIGYMIDQARAKVRRGES
jgi:hypothetical protein